MELMDCIWKKSHLIAPFVLFLFGITFKYLAQGGKAVKWEHAFFAPEIALSNAGSVLSAFVATTKSNDASQLSILVVLALLAVGALMAVTVIHRIFNNGEVEVSKDASQSRSNNHPTGACIFFLGGVANGIALVALMVTLYYTSTHKTSTTPAQPSDKTEQNTPHVAPTGKNTS